MKQRECIIDVDGASGLDPIGEPGNEGGSVIDPVGFEGGSIIDPIGGAA